MEINTFTEKLNKISGRVYVIEEHVNLKQGAYEALLAHDNIREKTVNVYTGPKLTGEKINTWMLSTPSDTPWKRQIRISAELQEAYISYETDGDTVEAEDVNLLQDSLVKTQVELNQEMQRAVKKEDELDRNLKAEMQRAVAQEKEITVQLRKETERAAGKENELSQMLTEEISRAKTAENGLNENLMEEIQRAGESESILLQSQQVLAEQISRKVEKEDGKGLSENDYTTEEKNKLAGMEKYVADKIQQHNTAVSAHTDIRKLISELTNRLNTLVDSDDTTLDQLSEIVAYIKSNRTLIENVTTSKVNVTDIINSLTASDTDKPLSAAQGKVLKELITQLENTVKAINLNDMLNGLSAGQAAPKDDDYFISQYSGGGTTHTTYHRRPFKSLWNWIKEKLAAVAVSGEYKDLKNTPEIMNSLTSTDTESSLAAVQGKVLNEKIDGIQVGGRNLYTGTKEFNGAKNENWKMAYQYWVDDFYTEPSQITEKGEQKGLYAQTLTGLNDVIQDITLPAGYYTVSAFVKSVSDSVQIYGMAYNNPSVQTESLTIEEAFSSHTTDMMMYGKEWDVIYYFLNESQDVSAAWNNFSLEIFQGTKVVTLRSDAYGWTDGNWELTGDCIIDANNKKHPRFRGSPLASSYMKKAGVMVMVKREQNHFNVVFECNAQGRCSGVTTEFELSNLDGTPMVVHLTGEKVKLSAVRYIKGSQLKCGYGNRVSTTGRITLISKKWTRVWASFYSNGSRSAVSFLTLDPEKEYQICGMKLERGNRAGDYSEAPEDTGVGEARYRVSRKFYAKDTSAFQFTLKSSGQAGGVVSLTDYIRIACHQKAISATVVDFTITATSSTTYKTNLTNIAMIEDATAVYSSGSMLVTITLKKASDEDDWIAVEYTVGEGLEFKAIYPQSQ
jgi:hypothetical protein